GPEEREQQLLRRVLFRRLALGGRHTSVVLPSLTLLKIATEQWRLRKASLRYIVNGIDCDRFAVAERHSPPGDPVTIGTVATLRREKNLRRLIEAFAQARHRANLELLIVGDGPERGALEEVAKAAGCADHVHFAGATRTPEIHYARMDIFS